MKLHIKYLRSFGDTPEVRASCLRFLKDSLIYFYPERDHIVEEARKISEELGQPLGAPELSWKYTWLEWMGGWSLVKPAQRLLRRIRWRTAKRVDYVLYQLESSSTRKPERVSGHAMAATAAVHPALLKLPAGSKR